MNVLESLKGWTKIKIWSSLKMKIWMYPNIIYMDIYKNIEIHREFNVSAMTVGRWIEGAIAGRNNLQLEETKPGRWKVVKNEHNRGEILRLQERGEKNKATKTFAKVKPKSKFYSLYNEDEILEIINSLGLKKETPFKLAHKDNGPKIWEEYLNKVIKDPESKPSITKRLLEESLNYLNYSTKNIESINVIDLSSRILNVILDFTKDIQKNKKVNWLTSVDISEEMLSSNKKTLHKNDIKIDYRDHLLDVENNSLIKVLSGSRKSFRKTEMNLIFHVGHTIPNHEDPVQVLKNIRHGMSDTDLLILDTSIETFNDDNQLKNLKVLNRDQIFADTILKYLNIDTENCDYNFGYSPKEKCKSMTIRLDKDYEIEFEIQGKKIKVNLYKDDNISVWKHYVINLEDFIQKIKKADLEIKYLSTDLSNSNALVICKVAS